MNSESAPAVIMHPGCKVNLFLHILSRRDDGYHELDTLFLFLPEPTDVLSITRTSGNELSFSCSNPALEGEGNLVVKAWKSFTKTSGFTPGLNVRLEKRAPIGAGIGGGSADAAAMLLALEEMAQQDGKGLGMERLSALACALGADVPFFLRKNPCLATGVGEKLREVPELLDAMRGLHLVLCTPPLHVSTSWAYGAWDAANGYLGNEAATAQKTERPKKAPARGPAPANPGLTDQKSAGIGPFCLEGLELCNSFEAVVFKAHGSLRSLYEELLRAGAAGALLSGSGSSLFGIFRDAQKARAAVERLQTLGATAHMHNF